MNRSRISKIFLAAVAGAFAAGTTHLVVKGDTLWDITGKYLGDPYQWPSVWQKNPQIKDAHWIYPGDQVLIEGTSGEPVPSGTSAPSESVPESAPGAVVDPLAGFAPNPLNQAVVAVDTSNSDILLIVPPSQTMLNQEMVVRAPVLYPPDEKAPAFQTAIGFDPDYGRQLLMPGYVILGNLGSEDGVKVGDRMEIVENNDQVATNLLVGTKGRLEETRALAEVVEVRPRSMLCRLVSVYGLAGNTAKIRRFEPPKAVSVTRFETIEEPTAARVVVNTGIGRVQQPGSFVIVDRGESEGIGQGDIFEFMDSRTDRGLLAMRGYGLVVRTTRTTATIQLVGVTPKPIHVGDKAWRIRRSVRG
jgi:hypothetical protein